MILLAVLVPFLAALTIVAAVVDAQARADQREAEALSVYAATRAAERRMVTRARRDDYRPAERRTAPSRRLPDPSPRPLCPR